MARRRSWIASPCLLGPALTGPGRGHAVKDPSIVRFGDRWHLFVTVRGGPRSHRLVYLTFDDWRQAQTAPRHELPFAVDMVAGPQVFFFGPHRRWYLIAQACLPSDGDRAVYGPVFSTSSDLRACSGWSPLQPLRLGWGARPPKIPVGPRLVSPLPGARDFWVIGDDNHMHVFFTTGDGRMWRSWTTVEAFPSGWTLPTVALRGDLFEASHVYRAAHGGFVCIVEARRRGLRVQRRFDAADLEGPWRPLSRQPFAAAEQLTFEGRRWCRHVSHGELIRAGHDERMLLGAQPMQWLFQGLRRRHGWPRPYGQWPWRLGLLRANS